MSNSMPCPRCGKQHEQGEYGPRPELATKPLGPPLKNNLAVRSGTPYAPPDVHCECGAILRYTVPVFKVTSSGWIWTIL